jgi:hypothetical protein
LTWSNYNLPTFIKGDSRYVTVTCFLCQGAKSYIKGEIQLMKKYSVLFAIIALVLASLACQTVMGGRDNSEIPNVPSMTEMPPQTDGDVEIPTVPPATTEGNGGVTVGGESEFPVPSDATNVISAAEMVTFQTKMSSDDVMKFYRDEFAKQGYKEDPSMSMTFGKTFTLAFTGHKSGKVIYVVGADAGDGSLYVTVTLA